MDAPLLVIGFEMAAAGRALVAEAIGGRADITYLADLDAPARADVLRRATVLLSRNTDKDLREGEAALLGAARLVQFMNAGVDYVHLSALPGSVPVATNGGAHAGPIAEHVIALAYAAAKRLLMEHGNLRRGAFNQFTRNRMLAGAVCGIFGFGGIGRATARLARAVGMRVHAINRSGRGGPEADWIGTPDRLHEMLAATDVLVIAAPLTQATRDAIGAAELGSMKEDAILVNIARGEIVVEAALYEHLRSHPRFTACIDAWWVEPVRHGAFRMDHPFLDLPNVIGSPHNSAQAGPRETPLRHALENCRRALEGETPLHLIGEDERML